MKRLEIVRGQCGFRSAHEQEVWARHNWRDGDGCGREGTGDSSEQTHGQGSVVPLHWGISQSPCHAIIGDISLGTPAPMPLSGVTFLTTKNSPEVRGRADPQLTRRFPSRRARSSTARAIHSCLSGMRREALVSIEIVRHCFRRFIAPRRASPLD